MSDLDMMEYLVAKKPGVKEKAGKFFVIWITILLFVVGFYLWMVLGNGLGLLIELAGAGMCFLNKYVIFPRFEVEYEYLYCNKTINIDVIYGQNSRKNVGEYELEKMEILAPENSHKLDEYKNRNLETKEYYSGIPYEQGQERESIPYVMIYNGKEKIILDLPHDFVKMVHNNAPRKVHFD